jgi:hypothetical protein
MSLGHIISEGATGQNSRGIDRLDIIVWGLTMQKLIDVIAMAESIRCWGNMTSQPRTLNKLSKSSSMPNQKIWLHSIFGMRMSCPSNKVFKVAYMARFVGNHWARKLVGLYNRADSIRLNK